MNPTLNFTTWTFLHGRAKPELNSNILKFQECLDSAPILDLNFMALIHCYEVWSHPG